MDSSTNKSAQNSSTYIVVFHPRRKMAKEELLGKNSGDVSELTVKMGF